MMQGRPFPQMKWKVFCVIQLIHLNCVNMQSFVPVLSCPETKDEWTQRSNAKNCQGSTPDYLCASIQNNPGSFGEICTVLGLANPRTCAVLSKSTYNMDFVSCRVASGCPATHYTPSELYNYPVCFKNFYGATTQSSITTQGTAEVTLMREAPKTVNGHSGTDVGIVFAVVVQVLILLIAIGLVIVFVLYRKRKLPTQMEIFLTERIEGSRFLHWFGNETRRNRSLEDRSRDEREIMLNIPAQMIHTEHRPEKQILMLQRYLTRILKSKLKVTELQENIILCSRSLKEHFNEYLIKDLNDVKTEDDYDNLYMNLVFALLTNFCKDIKPPGIGWGYEPPKNEDSEGADIERIRSMWNKYCDNDHNYPQLEDVYNRMFEKHGEIHERKSSKEDETIEDVRTKYRVLMLKKDCTIKDEVVVTESIKSALQLLETSDVVICKGAIGCGKTTAMRYIQKQFKEKQWRTMWMEEFVDDSDLSNNVIENTLLCCDNLFGTFNCKLFSSDYERLEGISLSDVSSLESPAAFQNIIEKKRKIYGKHLKIVLGIHNHVHDVVMRECVLELFQNKRWIIDMDEHTQAELLLIWKEKQKDEHSVHDSKCWCKKLTFSSVSAKLSLNRGLVGNPFLISMYCIPYHDHHFFSNDEFTKSPVLTLVDHFKNMYKENPELFYALVYVMYVTVCSRYQGIEDWAGFVNANLTTASLHNTVDKYPEFFYKDEETIELKHELLNITLFKASAEINDVRNSLVHNCGIHIILQLARPQEKCNNEFVTQFSLFDDVQKAKLRQRI
ncbi:uncharacterized protein LOC134278984 isoform X1 [Saccostrea cucullata]|uniref:uncharacterized protein LOC134278984 isoform X1 n=1 Tax=Saccostrea cuccullata TaxID=36930 RepID=UPI002ED1B3AF